MPTTPEPQRIAEALAGILLTLVPAGVLAQGPPTASQSLALSAFGAATGTYTNLLGGRNLGITAGGDLAFLTYRRFRPVLEIRGTYPFYDGHINNQRSFSGGIKVERAIGPFHPYVNFLIGRGEINYTPPFLYNGLIFYRTVSTIYSPGFGVDYDVTAHWAAKVDFQYQHWDAPIVPSGVLNPKALSVGAIYRFDFNPRHRRVR